MMKETEYYFKVHNFLYDDLHLPDVPMRVFAFIFTMAVSCENKPLWGIKYLSSKTHLCQRSIKQALKCLVNIGLLRKGDVLEDGSQTYTLAIKDCGTTTEAKDQLVNSVHQCTAFTGAHHSTNRCTTCTYGGAYHAPKVYKRIMNNNIKRYGNRRIDREPSSRFNGSDTL